MYQVVIHSERNFVQSKLLTREINLTPAFQEETVVYIVLLLDLEDSQFDL